MAPSVTKRRKLSHTDNGDEDDAPFSERFGGSPNDTDLSADDSTEVEDAVESDGSMASEDEEAALAKEEAHEGGRGKESIVNQKIRSQARRDPNTNKRRADIPLDGVYTAEIFKSNMFKLQVDELLEQVRPEYGQKQAPAENAMRSLKAIIERIPSRDPLSVHDAERYLMISSKVATPFPHPRPPRDAKYKLQYDRPSSINVAGSYPLKMATSAGEKLAIDLVITMPSAMFQDKDYLNYRYFYKRAYYLACIAAGIKESKEHKFKLTFDCLNGNHLQPIIVVSPSGDGSPDDFSGSKCRIHIILAAAEQTFPCGKLLPEKNCVRPTCSDDENSAKTLDPTPIYNATLKVDLSVTAYLKLLHATSSRCDAYKDACMLGRIWLKQRGFCSHIRKGGFGNFEWAAIMAMLLQSKPGAGVPLLSSGFSSYQLFKATLQFLANRDLSRVPFVFEANDTNLTRTEGTPIFFDGPRGLNILFKMTPWSYKLLQQEASIAVKMLADSTFDQFEPTFILRADPLSYRYDSVLEIPILSLIQDINEENFNKKFSETCRKLYNVLLRALGNRVTLISIILPEEETWPLGSSKPFVNREGRLLLGFATDSVNSERTVDHGPAAENKNEAASFRKFWGEKAELRRFKDGSILESVVWSQKEGSGPILKQIIQFILRRHISADVADKAIIAGNQFATLIPSGDIVGQSGTAPFLSIMNAFSALEKDIRNLENLPLQIRHILGADPQLRYSSIDPPRTVTHRQMSIPASIIIQFEGSGRWPDDLAAIQRTKIAFLLKLAELLSEHNPELTTRVGLENPSYPSQNQSFLDITTSSGHSFRLRIHHEREATLLERRLKDKTFDGTSREAAALALAVYKSSFLRIPAHTQAIQTLCTRFPAVSPSIRLVKKWFTSHLLTPHFAPELIELLVARTFLQPYPWNVPACATTGFLRTLFWISRWDWRYTPLIVDFSSAEERAGMKADEPTAITTRFEAWRRIDPALNRVVLFAASNLDPEGATWTDRARPAKVVAGRMTALARAAVAALKDNESMIAAGKASLLALEPEMLFVSSLTDYDFVLHLAPRYTRAGKAKKEARADNSMFKNLQLQAEADKGGELVGYDPVTLFTDELQEIYGHAVIWFYDTEGGDTVAGLWNPAMTARRSWRVRGGYSSVPLAGTGTRRGKGEEVTGEVDGVEVEINKEGILNEIARLGGELVERVEILKK
ncbi:Nrap protein [Lepidopterella palustris CBS 459.81]|uniref:U3 small nucleolar RNA-associated protein 22 n=1 Tax=Lepidopterella palustris CBS 459.81 TaxID=1314670 RepID=A0A8E2ELE0_9PEZI|nr:Nrap protein [Lepidopterella palustris CBS 459.81]